MRAERHPGHSVSLKIDRFRQSLRDDVLLCNISLVRRDEPGPIQLMSPRTLQAVHNTADPFECMGYVG
jgi:hypothetical protein